MTSCYEHEGQRLWIRNDSGWPFIMVRGADLPTLVALMERLGLVRALGVDENGDPEPKPLTLDGRRGERVANITGPLYPVRVPAVTDPVTGEITTPAVLDSRPHLNIRFYPTAMQNLTSEGVPLLFATAIQWAANGAIETVLDQNNHEEGIKYNGAVLLDPDSIATPSVMPS